MQAVIPLEHMSIEEKLAAIEVIWASLTQCPEDAPSPDWHKVVLEEREKHVAEGISQFFGLQEAKKAMREKLL